MQKLVINAAILQYLSQGGMETLAWRLSQAVRNYRDRHDPAVALLLMRWLLLNPGS